MPAILDALRGRIAARATNALDTIAAGARAAARGESGDAGAIEKALAEAGQTFADFERAVEVARQRAGWLADFDRLAAAAAKAKKLEQASAVEQQKFEAARAAFLERATAIDTELSAHRTACDKGTEARAQLLDPRYVPGTLGDQYRAAVNAAEAATAALERAQRNVREQAAAIKSEEEWIAQLSSGASGTKTVKPSVLPSFGGTSQAGESFKLQDHRAALARAQRRKAEADAALVEAEKAAASTRRAVDALIPDVLKS